jgi:hypothetical protein
VNDQQIRRLLQAGHKSHGPSGIVEAHLDASGKATPRSGDDEAPFTKLNPFCTPPQDYWRNALLPLVPDPSAIDLQALPYLKGPVIDVSQWRTLTIYGECLGQISLLPYAAAGLQSAEAGYDLIFAPRKTVPLTPLGVIDPALTAVAQLGEPGLSSRTAAGTELRNAVDTSFSMTLSFDVTMFSVFQFRAGQLSSFQEQLTLIYSLSM